MRAQIQVRSNLTERDTKALLGKKGRPEDAPLILRGDASVYKPDGTRLLQVVRGGIGAKVIDAAWPFLWSLRTYESMNRGAYAGVDRENKDGRGKVGNGVRYRAVKNDGTLSNTSHATPIRSAIAGFFDRNPRFPYCREASFSSNEPESWGKCLPFVQQVADLFAENVPDRHIVQLTRAQETHPAYIIPGTPFTTLTINNTVSGAYHTDKGDYKPGFGVMVVLRRGHYRGCEIVFPRYGVGADLQHGDVIFFDPHEVHGNTPFFEGVGKEGEDWVRISIVLYYREKMIDCLEPALELERAKGVRGGITLSE